MSTKYTLPCSHHISVFKSYLSLYTSPKQYQQRTSQRKIQFANVHSIYAHRSTLDAGINCARTFYALSKPAYIYACAHVLAVCASVIARITASNYTCSTYYTQACGRKYVEAIYIYPLFRASEFEKLFGAKRASI